MQGHARYIIHRTLVLALTLLNTVRVPVYTAVPPQATLPVESGVCTPGTAFAKSSLVKRMTDDGFVFRTVPGADPLQSHRSRL